MCGCLICNKKVSLRTLLFFLISLNSIRLSAQQKDEFVSNIFISESGDSLPYRLYVPMDIHADSIYPIIIYLHGKGERGVDNEKQLHWIKKWLPDSLKAQNKKAFILAPQCSADRYWNNYDKLAENITFDSVKPEIQKSLIELIDTLQIKFAIDKKREYLIGLSMGGFGVFDLITRYPNKFAAAISICGGADPNQSQFIKQTPVWAFHGQKDAVVNKRHTIVTMNKVKDESHILTLYENMNHGIWQKAFSEPDLIKWLFSNSR